MAKTSKPGGADAKQNNKKKKKSGPESVAMKVQAPKPSNPFETIWSRRKFDILGKKRKGEERRVGLARSRAIDKRKKTLLKEYEQSGKSSVFVDRRIGEQNEALGEFDKAILRSQRERKLKLSKKSKYNLSDGEEEDFDVSGFGSLSGRDDFEDEMLPDDDEDYGGQEGAGIEKDPFALRQNVREGGQSEGEDNKHKTKKEVMEEIILKSKFFKAQKAKEKEENEQLMGELDKNFTSLVQSKALLSVTEPGKMNALKALVNKSITNEQVNKDVFSATRNVETSNQEKPDAYDKMVKAMALEMRARPSDRTKTPEEIAQEERERLEQLEEERQKRMLARDEYSDEEDEDAETQRPRAISGDDLGDSFSLVEEPRAKKGWVDEILERGAETSDSEEGDFSEDSENSEDGSDEEGSDEDNDVPKDGLSIKDWEQSDDENLETGLDREEEEEDDDDQEHDEDDEADEKDIKAIVRASLPN